MVQQQNLSAGDTAQQGVIQKKKKGKVKSTKNSTIAATGNQPKMNNESPRLHTDGESVEGITSAPLQMPCMYWKTV